MTVKGQCKVSNFLKDLKEVSIEYAYNGDYEPSNEFRRGVNTAIEMAKTWFESNNIMVFDTEYDDE